MAVNQTSTFLGPEHSWVMASLQLDDVQPLYGGVVVYISPGTSEIAYVSRMTAGGRETQYEIPLPFFEKAGLCQLCIAQDFLTILPDERRGIPDEVRQSITLTNARGQGHRIAKWANVADSRFDAIYLALLAIAERAHG